jgi:hypothetical protein
VLAMGERLVAQNPFAPFPAPMPVLSALYHPQILTENKVAYMQVLNIFRAWEIPNSKVVEACALDVTLNRLFGEVGLPDDAKAVMAINTAHYNGSMSRKGMRRRM